MSAPVRLVYMGTPDFAVPSLRALTALGQVVGVVTQPDRPAGRGQKLSPPPVKQFALAAGLPIIQPARLREPEAMAQLTAWQPDLIVVAAFGQLLKPAVLDLPRWGCLNVHASLLPRWRGAAPIAAALLAGDAETGVTLMRMDPGLDTGPLLARRAEAIRPDDTTPALTARLAEAGAALLAEQLPAYLRGELRAEPQDPALATYAPQLKKEDGRLDFSQPAEALARRVRALLPWPAAFALWQGQPFKILRAAPLPDAGPAEPGLVFQAEQGPAVACGQGALRLDET
ncbi:MAG: methionyl-tRNA formyltransferase, partial [Anaerolineales bacterium]|nr:methionyl-tRNA formyltransferase [Anaerolineales bacterium]